MAKARISNYNYMHVNISFGTKKSRGNVKIHLREYRYIETGFLISSQIFGKYKIKYHNT